MSCHGGLAVKDLGDRACRALAALAAAPAAALAQVPAPVTGTGQPGVIPGQYIVVMKGAASEAAKERTKGRARARGGHVNHDYSRALKGYAASLPPAALADVRSDPDVAYVEADAVMTATTTQTGAPWGLDRIDQREPAARRDLHVHADRRGREGVHHRHRHAPDARAVRRVARPRATTRSTAARPTTATGTARTSPAPSAARRTASPRASRSSPCACSTARARARPPASSPASTGSRRTIAAGQPAVANMSLGGGASTSLDTAVADLDRRRRHLRGGGRQRERRTPATPRRRASRAR